MTPFDVGRIVPSTRDLFGALATQRKSLALLPELSAGADAQRAQRLAGLDVRAFAVDDRADALLGIARATASTPSLCLAPCSTIEDCQRARFHGADGVCLAATTAEEWTDLSRTAQSMHMMPLARVHDVAGAEAAVVWGARALVVAAAADTVTAIAAAFAAPKLLVASVSDVDTAGLRGLRGVVDAAVVPSAIHASGDFEALLNALDG